MGSFPVTVWIECGGETCDGCDLSMGMNCVVHRQKRKWKWADKAPDVYKFLRLPACLAAEAAHKEAREQ